jgi:hypothetical protein
MRDNVIEANPTKVSDYELEELRSKIAEQKRVDEYKKLKTDL